MVKHADVVDVFLNKLADAEYKIYGTATIEDRAIPGTTDGLKPVTRRALWATYKLGLHSKAKHVKSARVVGDTLGYYHPHGDMACYDAIVTAVNAPQRMIDGLGNWGTPLDNAAAHRYTNLRLSLYSDAVFFDPFYASTVQMVPNYDGSHQEPLNLVTLLPNVLINGNFGIATGVSVRTPSFTVESILKIIKIGLKRDVTAKDCFKHLEFTSANGAYVNKEHPGNSELLSFFKTGKGRVRFDSRIEDTKDGGLRISSLPPVGLEGALNKVAQMPSVASVNDDSSVTDQYPLSYKVTLKRGAGGTALTSTRDKVREAFSCFLSFDVKVTDRMLDKEGKPKISLRPTTVPEIINEWIDYRLELERAACTYHIGEVDKKIYRVDLLRLAIKNLDFIVKLLKAKGLSDEQMVDKLAKRMKVAKEFANEVLNFRVRQLRALEDVKLLKQRQELMKEKKALIGRKKNPEAYVDTTLKLLGEIAHKNFVAKAEAARAQRKLRKK